MPIQTTRRQFLKSSTLATFGAFVAPRLSLAADPAPDQKLRIAAIGTGNRALDNINGCASQSIVALCDVDERILAKTASKFPSAKTFTDFRAMLDKIHNNIDAVLVGTPDHTHAPATLAALQLKKHVYCEKPLAHTVHEARLVASAASNAKVATQMGTQIHAESNYRRVVELLQSGAIGTVNRIHVWVGGSRQGGNRPTDTPPVPQGLHWDLWIGPAPFRPYHPAYHPFSWRGWWDFGGGTLADMACHHMDLSHWAFNLRYPSSIHAQGPKPHPESCPEWLIVDYHYPATPNRQPIHLTWYNGDKRPQQLIDLKLANQWGAGSLFIGDKGMLLADYGRRVLLPNDQFKDFQPPNQSIPPSIGHHNEWIKACKDNSPTTCNFSYAAALTETVLLGNVSYRLGKKLDYDPTTATCPNNPDAQNYITKEYRKGWSL